VVRSLRSYIVVPARLERSDVGLVRLRVEELPLSRAVWRSLLKKELGSDAGLRSKMAAVPSNAEIGKLVTSDPAVMHGEPVFRGTRVPVRTLLDHLEAGDSLEVFLADFPTVTREQAVQFLELAGEAALAGLGANSSR
jgi:uncharacterized protein (DUF433 family)